MKVYLGEMLLPVAPEKIKKSIKNQNTTKKLVNGEEINIPLPAGLMEISLSGVLLPNSARKFVGVGKKAHHEPGYYLTLLDTFKRERSVIAFTVNESSNGLCEDAPASSIDVTLEDFTIDQDASEGDNIIVDIKLKEYRAYGLAILPTKKDSDVTTVVQATAARTEKKVNNETTYTVKHGDTLWAIAKKYYGDGNKYHYLVELNKLKTNVLRTGQVLKIGPTADAKAFKVKSSTSKDTKQQNDSSTTQEYKQLWFANESNPLINKMAQHSVVINAKVPVTGAGLVAGGA